MRSISYRRLSIINYSSPSPSSLPVSVHATTAATTGVALPEPLGCALADRPSKDLGSSLKRCFAFACFFFSRSLQRSHSEPEHPADSSRLQFLLLHDEICVAVVNAQSMRHT